MNILFYSPFNQRSRDAESVMLALSSRGHRVISLSQQEGLFINDFLMKNNIEAHSCVPPDKIKGVFRIIFHLIIFVKYCWKFRVDVVFSHLESPNFISSIGQFFIKGKVIICRHHINEAALNNFDASISYRLTYWLAKRVVVVSEHAKRYMVVHEKINPNKIEHINLPFDHSLYQTIEIFKIPKIRNQYTADILLISVGRLSSNKRFELSIYLISELVTKGINARLIILGKGEMQSSLETLIDSLALKENIFLLGHVQNVLNYLSAADYLIHPSLSESSCVVVKEAGLVNKPVVICKGVGDFDEYLKHEANGFVVGQDSFVEEATEIIKSTYMNKALLREMGCNLNKDILNIFDINQIIKSYENLLVSK